AGLRIAPTQSDNRDVRALTGLRVSGPLRDRAGPDRLRVGRWRGLCGDRSVVGAEVPGQRLQVSMAKQERFGEWTIALLQPPVDLGDPDRVKAELLEGGALPEPWLGNLQHLTEAASQLREHRGVVGYLGRLGGRRRPGPFIRPDRL